MNTGTPRFLPHPSGMLVPLPEAAPDAAVDISMRLPRHTVNAQALAALARLLRHKTRTGHVRIDARNTLWLRVGSDCAPECMRALDELREELGAIPDTYSVATHGDVAFRIPDQRLSARQLYGLAALAYVEGTPVVRFTPGGEIAAFVAVPDGRHTGLRQGLAEFGLAAA